MTSASLTRHEVDLDEVRLSYLARGETDHLVVLLHGWPQTGRCWRHVVPQLPDDWTVVIPDLRGYGDSGLAATGYDKRATARDLAQLVERLGHEQATVVGHDRGARVAHRWALDRPEQVRSLTLLDVLPTLEVLETLDVDSAGSLWHWLFHRQARLPELLVGGHVREYLWHFMGGGVEAGFIEQEVFDEYVEAFSDPGHLSASFDDYRATFTTDREADEADAAADRRLTVPTMVLWGGSGGLAARDVIGTWGRHADRLHGASILGAGHYLPEQAPDVVAAHLRAFIGTATDDAGPTRR